MNRRPRKSRAQELGLTHLAEQIGIGLEGEVRHRVQSEPPCFDRVRPCFKTTTHSTSREPDAYAHLERIMEVGGDEDRIAHLHHEAGLLKNLASSRLPGLLAVIHIPGRDRPSTGSGGTRSSLHHQDTPLRVAQYDGDRHGRGAEVDPPTVRTQSPFPRVQNGTLETGAAVGTEHSLAGPGSIAAGCHRRKGKRWLRMTMHTRHNGGMFPRVSVSAALMLLGSLLWAGRLLIGPAPWEPKAASLLAAALVVSNSVNLVAMLLTPGRWVRNSIAALAGTWGVAAVALTVNPLWIGAFLAHAAGVAIAWTRSLDRWFHPARPDRVPARATALVLGLVWLPGFVGGLGIPTVTAGGWVLAGFGVLAGWAYARALPGVLWTIRLVLPILGAVSVIGLRLPAAAGMLAAASALTILAWTADARLAAMRPVPRRVASLTVPPELTPPGLMEAAGYDRRGRLLSEDG